MYEIKGFLNIRVVNLFRDGKNLGIFS